MARYLLDVDVSDPVPPQVTNVSRLPAEGETTSDMLSTFSVTVSEAMKPSTVNTPLYTFATYGGHTYVLTSSLTWTAAQSYAQGLGGELVTINDAAEQSWVYATFGSQSLWTGFNDGVKEGTWVWSSGEAVTYTNWASGEPNYSDYDCGYISSSNGKWYDGYESSGYAAVMELDSDVDGDGDGLPDVIDSHVTDSLNGWDLREAGADGLFDTADDDVYDLRVSPDYSSGTTINLRLFDGPMDEGHYRLTVTSSLTDMVGNQLDGDGDGVGGDAYMRTFFVDLPDGFVLEGHRNDSLATATALTLEEDPVNSGLFFTHTRGIGSIDPAVYQDRWNESDYWRFEALAGDRVAVSVDTPNSSLNPYVAFYNTSGSQLSTDDDGGPDSDAYISYYTIPSSGTYYVRVGHYSYSSTVGTYQLRLDVARGIQLESDADYANDGVSGADLLTLTSAGIHRTATVVGLIMSSEGDDSRQGLLCAGSAECRERSGVECAVAVEQYRASSVDRGGQQRDTGTG